MLSVSKNPANSARLGLRAIKSIADVQKVCFYWFSAIYKPGEPGETRRNTSRRVLIEPKKRVISATRREMISL